VKIITPLVGAQGIGFFQLFNRIPLTVAISTVESERSKLLTVQYYQIEPLLMAF